MPTKQGQWLKHVRLNEVESARYLAQTQPWHLLLAVHKCIMVSQINPAKIDDQ